MMLNSGRDVVVLGEVSIAGGSFMICKLDTPEYIRETLVTHVLLKRCEFQEHCKQVERESSELVVESEKGTE